MVFGKRSHKLVQRMPSKGGGIMTIAQMITFAVCVLMLWLGYRSGYATGYVDGRKAVRYHYEKLERQFKQVGK